MTFTMVFAQNSILHLAVHEPITSSQLQRLIRRLKPFTQEQWPQLQHQFLHLYTCMHTKHLALKLNRYSRLVD